jgi:hypothetical protein
MPNAQVCEWFQTSPEVLPFAKLLFLLVVLMLGVHAFPVSKRFWVFEVVLLVVYMGIIAVGQSWAQDCGISRQEVHDVH